MGSDLDKILSLARSYERVEHGRVEHVGAYERAMGHLRSLAGPEITRDQHDQAHSDLRYGMSEPESGTLMRHVAQAHAAYSSGDFHGAHESLVNARNAAIYGSGSTRALQHVIRSAIGRQAPGSEISWGE